MNAREIVVTMQTHIVQTDSIIKFKPERENLLSAIE